MFKYSTLALLSVAMLASAPVAEARKNPGNPLPAPQLVDADILAAGAAECDGDDLTTDDVCVQVIFTKVCTATKYSVPVAKGFDTDDNDCDDLTLSEDNAVVAAACTMTNNCLGDTAECQTAVVPIGTTMHCVNDGDLTVDCVNDPEDVEVSYTSLCTKVKGLNPSQKGPNAPSQSTPFSNTLCPDINDECM